MSEEDNLI